MQKVRLNATLGFADHMGFRCGTCHSFPVFDLKDHKPLKLYERPLIIMEGTLLSEQYMGLSKEQTLEYIERLSHTCRFYIMVPLVCFGITLA